MKTPHVHAETIRAWADGAEIEVTDGVEPWTTTTEPFWRIDCKYRVKPEPQPDLIYYAAFGPVGWDDLETEVNQRSDGPIDSLKLTFCAETHKLKSAEILK